MAERIKHFTELYTVLFINFLFFWHMNYQYGVVYGQLQK